MVKALFNGVIIKPIEEEESSYGTIVVPDMGKEKNLKGEVISVGPGYYSGMGTFIETTVKKGDIVLLPQMGPIKVDYEGEEYYMIEENKILAIIKK
jgi:co-chaperonin GroES (HSP10)